MPGFWFTSVVETNSSRAFQNLKEALVVDTVAYSTLNIIDFPPLKYGTLDNLIALLEKLPNLAASAQALLRKLKDNLEQSLKEELDQSHFMVNNKSFSEYILRFKWNNLKYKPTQSINDFVENSHKEITTIETMLRSKQTQYNSIKTKLLQIERKRTGNLSIKSLNDVVKKEDCINNSEFLTTQFVAVPKNLYKEWNNKYETMCERIVPRSSCKIAEDEEYGLFSVVVFKKKVDEFRSKCRENKFIVRDFVYDESMILNEEAEYKKVEDIEQELWRSLVQICSSSFEEVAVCFVHIKIVNVLVESILRYGLPPKYFGAVFVVQSESKTQKAMEKYQKQYTKEFKPLEKKVEEMDLNVTTGEGDEYSPFVKFVFEWDS